MQTIIHHSPFVTKDTPNGDEISVRFIEEISLGDTISMRSSTTLVHFLPPYPFLYPVGFLNYGF